MNVLKNPNNREQIREVGYNHSYLCGFHPGIMYGLANVHKPVKDRWPSLRLILFALNTPSYKLPTFFVLLLTRLTSNDYTIKDSFSFPEEMSSFDCAHFMTSFYKES